MVDRAPFLVDSNFPGGNILLDGINGNIVRIHQDLRDTDGHWFYWYFRVRGASGKTLRFEFPDARPLGIHGPAVSFDEGLHWDWLGAESVDDNACIYKFGPDDDPVRFSVGIPYVLDDLNRWLATHASDARLSLETLCQSPKGRQVPLLKFEASESSAFGINLTARHHCCEAMASYVLEGILERILTDDWFAQNIRATAVPFVDFDGVQAGDQGKNRKPHDHNRDYIEDSLYPETRAIRELLLSWPGGPADLNFDFHCPSLKGGLKTHVIHQVGSPFPENAAEQAKFGEILEQVNQSSIPYVHQDDMSFGEDWNVWPVNPQGGHSTRWAYAKGSVRLSSSIEIPYADAHDVQMTPERSRQLGYAISDAIRIYLQSIKP